MSYAPGALYSVFLESVASKVPVWYVLARAHSPDLSCDDRTGSFLGCEVPSVSMVGTCVWTDVGEDELVLDGLYLSSVCRG